MAPENPPAFTPGPWTVALWGGRAVNGAAAVAADRFVVASVPRKADRSLDRKLADITLIAASPAMYDALCAVEHLATSVTKTHVEVPRDEWADAMTLVHAALVAAEGSKW